MDKLPTLSPAAGDGADAAALAARITGPIVLVGMMGSGKSSVGRRLAGQLGLPFADADDEIELAAGLKISEIFERYGEAQFRDGERRVIARLMDAGPSVLATGGGAFAQDATRACILDRGVAVWLDAPLKILVERTAKRGHRPLLNAGNPESVLAALLAERTPAYSQAHVRIASDSSPHARTVQTVITALGKHLA